MWFDSSSISANSAFSSPQEAKRFDSPIPTSPAT